MKTSDRPEGYSVTQISLHWLIALLMIPLFALHDPIVEAWEAMAAGEAANQTALVQFHVYGGIIVLMLAAWRLTVRVRRGVPPLPEEEPAPQRAMAHLTHWALYAMMFTFPITGILAWYAGFETADTIHTGMKLVLLGFFGLHVLGALYQQFVLRTNIMARMRWLRN